MIKKNIIISKLTSQFLYAFVNSNRQGGPKTGTGELRIPSLEEYQPHRPDRYLPAASWKPGVDAFLLPAILRQRTVVEGDHESGEHEPPSPLLIGRRSPKCKTTLAVGSGRRLYTFPLPIFHDETFIRPRELGLA